MSQGNTTVPAQAQEEAACPIGEVLDHISGKWSIGIIVAAAAGPVRFTELERAIDGISRRMLTLSLRKLERDGLLVRTVYPTVPPRVEYRLTPIARELGDSFATLTAWAQRHRRAIAASRTDYDRRPGGPASGLAAAASAAGISPRSSAEDNHRTMRRAP
jgi:DNA-binding HxlR family transcriptional regulator